MHPIASSPATWSAGALVAFVLYRRVRRNFGMQRWQPGRTVFRFGLAAFVALALLVAAPFVPHGLWAVPASLALGAGLGWLGLGKTDIHWESGAGVYRPNPWIGAALTLALVARLAWRFLGDGTQAPGQPAHATALTLALAGLLMGYSLAYNGGLIHRMRRLESDARSRTAPPMPDTHPQGTPGQAGEP